MATKSNLSCFVVAMILIVILSNQVLHTQARVLAADNAVAASNGSVRSPSYKDIGKNKFSVEDDGYMDTYRPTTPGHSPGIGHSKHD